MRPYHRLAIYGRHQLLIAQRTQELGIRAALGTARGSLLALVIRIVLAGMVSLFGVVGSLALSRLLDTLLFGVFPRDPATLTAIALSMPQRTTKRGLRVPVSMPVQFDGHLPMIPPRPPTERYVAR